MNYKRYTKEEDKLILREVKNSPTNLQIAFRKLGTELDRKPRSIAERYYRHLQKKKNNIFFLISPKKKSKNYKVTRFLGPSPTNYKPETFKSKWKRIFAILAE